jgi:hypothetical protein
MALLQGDPLPNIKTTKDTSTQGPDWYNKYLEDLASAGTTTAGMTGEQLVAPLSELQQGVATRVAAPGALQGYTTELDKAKDTADLAAAGVTPEMIASFYNPQSSAMTSEMARLQEQNMQRSMLPALKSAFAGTGGFGGQRMFNALGQMGADAQANLLGAQTKEMRSSYDSALKAAMDQAGLYRNAAETQKGLATTEQDAQMKELEKLWNIGGEQQKLEQAKILAPLSAAKTAADVYSNVKVPSTVSEKSDAPIPGAYSTSPLAQIAGLGSLFSNPAGGKSPAQGFTDFLSGFKLPSWATDTTGGSTIGGEGPQPGDPNYVAPPVDPDTVDTDVDSIDYMPPI